ncbi:hypothetical protein ACH5RR_004714 [Cinchona calisaya]|uniref:Reverse transcriptase zinc-binding domain-containing protein n=1 Tax=Cinchona calisaya TaxID=153742 RepID=A0ABD3AYZ8_9GENT
MVEEELRIRVGDEKIIKIWQDKWIPSTPDGRVSTPRPAGCKARKVNELMNENNQWNIPMLKEIFSDHDCHLIQKIPLSLQGGKDRYHWAYTKNGNYTVKSGYVQAKSMQDKEITGNKINGETSRRDQNSSVWRNLRGLNIKYKIKHFISKCLQGILPTNEAVHRRTGKGDNICHRCGEGVDSVEHMLFFCKNIEQAWKMFPLQWDGLNEERWSF